MVQTPGGEFLGSGALIHSGQKLVLTNYHVVREYKEAYIFFPDYLGNELVTQPSHYSRNEKKLGIPGQVVARDPRHDLALLELSTVSPKAKALQLVQKSPEPGSNVHSIGASGESDGALWRLTSGQVRQVYQTKFEYDTGQEVSSFVVETQSPTNRGDSGGPVVNDRVQMVAVVAAGSKNQHLVSKFIDIREIREFLKEYFQSKGQRWEDVPSSVPSQILDVSTLVKRLSGDEKERLQALQMLAELGSDAQSAIPAVIPFLKDNDPVIRGAAANTLEQIGLPAKSDIGLLVNALKDENLEIRLYAARTLSKTDLVLDRGFTPSLVAALKDQNPTIRSAVISAIGNAGPEARDTVLLPLMGMVKDPDASVGKKALDALAGLGEPNPKELSIFRDALSDQNSEVRRFAAFSLCFLGPNAIDALSALQKAFKDQDVRVRINSVLAIGQMGLAARPALPDLQAAMSDTHPEVRFHALKAIIGLGKDPAAVGILVNALKDSEPQVCRIAGEALMKLDILSKEHIPTLEVALKSSQAVVRTFAAQSLGKFGKEAKTSVAALMIAAKDKDLQVRFESVQALGLIGENSKEVIPLLTQILAEKIADSGGDESASGDGEANPARAEEIFSQLQRGTVWVVSHGFGFSSSGWLVDRGRKLVLTSNWMAGSTNEVMVFFPKGELGKTNSSPALYCRLSRRRVVPFGTNWTSAKVVGVDSGRGLALLQLAGVIEEALDLPLAAQGPSAGQKVYSMGAFMANLSTGAGALWQRGMGEVKETAALDSGFMDRHKNISMVNVHFNSDFGDGGCPLVNNRGEVVGTLTVSGGFGSPAYFGVDAREIRRFITTALGQEWTGKTESGLGTSGNAFSRDVRAAAVFALGKMGTEAIPTLVKMLEDKDPKVKTMACESLGGFGVEAKAAIPDLILGFRDAALREKAVEALAKIGVGAVPSLVDSLASRSSSVRLGAAMTLGKIGPPAKSAVVKLTIYTKDPSPEVRKAVWDALARIQRK